MRYTLLAMCIAGLSLAITIPSSARGAVTQSTFSYKSSVSSDSDGLLDLVAELNYDNSVHNAPIVVLMHGYSTGGELSVVRANAQRLRDAGFFAISVAMRGRAGSDGTRDSGGVEIYDIYDAVEAVKSQYAANVDSTNVSITGYSGGGGNVMSALTKFPDYFRVGSSFFGMSDYGYDATNGWYNKGAQSNHQTQLRTDIGNPNIGDAAVLDRYMARASNLASKNNPYSDIHLFVNETETTCPKVNDTSYLTNAQTSASSLGEFDNINVHIGIAGTYQDFDADGVNDSNEQQYWPHGYPTADQQTAGESWYLSRILDGSIAQPTLNASDTLFVTGFVKTTPFECWLGDGQNAAGDLEYSLSAENKTFSLDVLSSDPTVSSILKVDTSDMAGRTVQVLLDGSIVDEFCGGGVYKYTDLRSGGTVVFTAVPEPGTAAMAAVGMLLLTGYRLKNKAISREGLKHSPMP